MRAPVAGTKKALAKASAGMLLKVYFSDACEQRVITDDLARLMLQSLGKEKIIFSLSPPL
jgi:TusA-related sulfurtransferase